jgi:death-on-curing protein
VTSRRAPAFLTLDEVLALHADQVARYGGAAGVRELALLQSALASPRARSLDAKLLHATVPEQAAAYLFHLAQNHPFVDGNKRAALAASRSSA